jgi:enterochelin esterase-like enzyme
MGEIFASSNFDLDSTGVILMGHSFGGVSALYTAIKNNE